MVNRYSLLISIIAAFFFCSSSFSQCPTCGNGVVDAGETSINCPQDVPQSATCASPCGQPTSFEAAIGIRQAFDFVGTTTYSTAGLPAGWSFASGPSATTAGALPAADAYGAKAGLVQPNCSGSCTATNGFCIGNIANNVALGKLGANFDGRANVTQNLSYAVLRGQGSPTLVSPTFNMSGVESFKIQFWLNASETSCGQSNGWGSCVGNSAFLDFSTNGGTSWVQIMQMNTSNTAADMALNATTNTFWVQEGTWSRVCLTVFKASTSLGNFYPAATASTAPTGLMLNSIYFTANFKFRIRYVQTASCTSGITTTNPGRYLAIDYPVITSGNECIPCGLSFSNMCGYGQDNNDDGVGGSGTTTTTVFGTTRRSINNAERGVEILTSQNAVFGSQNLSGSNFATNFDLCNPEGGDKQCIDWQTNNNSYFSVYEVVSDFEISNVNLQYYKGTTPQSSTLSKVTAAGKTALIGWRYSGNRIVNCGSSGDLNPGCNGYYFVTPSLPSQFIRAFYALNTNNLGNAYSYYGPSSASNYFAGPMFSPISKPDTLIGAGNYVTCNGTDPVFTGIVDYCASSVAFTGLSTLSVTGPNGFSETITSGASGTIPIVDVGDYIITSAVPNSPEQCLDCGKSVCISLTASDINICSVSLGVNLNSFEGSYSNRKVSLNWTTQTETNNNYFTVERSIDGIQFIPICNENGQGNASNLTTYTCNDEEPLLNEINYYQLKQVDLDGTETILKTIAVDCSENEELVLTPLSTSGDFMLLLKAKAFSNAPYFIYDQLGATRASGMLKNGQALVHLDSVQGVIFIKVLSDESLVDKRVILD